MAKTVDTAGDAGKRERLLTVAQVRAHSNHADVMFFETARIYRLPRTNPAYDSAIERGIRSASPLPVPPPNSELFPQFRELNLNFRHER